MEDGSKKLANQKFAIILLGDSSVGKTAIFNRCINNKFEENNNASIGVEFSTKTYTYQDKDYSLQIFDTAGEERFRCITQSYYHLGEGAFIIFDLTNKDTLESVKIWLKDIEEANNNNTKLIILGNKNDLKEEHKIPDDEINDFLSEFNIKFFKVSAKDGSNIEEAIYQMIDLLVNDSIDVSIIERIKSKNLKEKKNMDKCC